MKISVVMAAYNAEKYLKEAMDSILGQTYDDLELIVIDDKSTDTSGQILKDYAARDSRVVVLENEENMGLTTVSYTHLTLPTT